MYDAVIFDNDGVLTRPTATATIRAAVRAAFREFGVEPSESDVARAVDSDVTSLEDRCAAHGVDLRDFWTRREAHAATAQRRALETGAKPLYDDVDAIFELPVPLAVVSNNQHRTVEHILDVFDLRDRFETAYGRDPDVDGVHRKKPDPHYVERALSDLDATDALYVGDSNVDVVAADRAGLDAAYVRRPHRPDDYLDHTPTHELTTLADLRDLF